MENLFLWISDEPVNPEGPTVPQQLGQVSAVCATIQAIQKLILLNLFKCP